MDFSNFHMWVGAMIHSQDVDNLVILIKAAIIVKEGVIVEIVDLKENDQLDLLKQKYQFEDEQISYLDGNQAITPGLVDCHTHAPQYSNLGIGLDLPLLEWLDTYTFPTEKAMSDPDFASRVYKIFVDKLIRNGSTTVCYFATLHLEATKRLADIVHERGQRAWVGKVNMDWHTPLDLTETTEESLTNTEEFIQYCRQEHFLKNNLVEPCITPRFAPVCSPTLLKSLGELAAKYQVPVQSHLCESKAEIKLAIERHPNYQNYTEIYRQNGLLTDRTMMAHCIYLEPEEKDMIKATGAGIAHCASSNFNLSSGVLDINPLIKADLKVGLGTDVSGGSSLSMLHAIQSTFTAAKITQVSKELSDCPLNIDRAFYLATLGGARAMGLEKIIGNFEVGKQFDALIVDFNFPNFNNDPLKPKEHVLKSAFCRFLQTGDENWISKVFVQGRQIHPINA